MKAQTKIEIECELLRLEHDVRHARNNESAFRLQATMARNDTEKTHCLNAADYHAKQRETAQAQIASRRALIEAHDYHALTVSEAHRDREWAERLAAA
jgi:hypothetical protein